MYIIYKDVFVMFTIIVFVMFHYNHSSFLCTKLSDTYDSTKLFHHKDVFSNSKQDVDYCCYIVYTFPLYFPNHVCTSAHAINSTLYFSSKT